MIEPLTFRLRHMFACACKEPAEAADHIEKLEAALHQWDDLIRHQYSGSREAMSDLTDAAQLTAALLHEKEPWPETRIEKLEAVTKDDAKWLAAYHQWCKMNGCAPSSSDLIAASKALDAE